MDEFLENKALMEGLDKVQTVEELVALLAEHNIELGAGESVEQLFAQLKAESTDELDEAMLEDVSGGSLSSTIKRIIYALRQGSRPLTPILPKRNWK